MDGELTCEVKKSCRCAKSRNEVKNMWNAIGESLKIFIEKHLIPTVVSVVVAILAFLVLPADYWVVEKLGKSCFLILVAGIIFLVIQLLIAIVKGIRHLCYKADLARQCRENNQKKNKEAEEDWLSFGDKLSPDDRALIIRLLDNDNKPEIVHGSVWHSSGSIFNTNLIIQTQGHNGYTLYKLDERAYQALKSIYKQRGSITHF